MNKTLSATLFALAVLLFAACGQNATSGEQEEQEKHHDHKVAGFSWKNLSVHDTVDLGDTVTHAYIYYNSGWKPARLTRAEPLNPRTLVDLPDRVLKVGEQDTVRITTWFRWAGKQARHIRIHHDAPEQPPFILSMIVQVMGEEEEE